MAAFPIVQGVEVLLEAPPGYVVDFDNPTLDHKNINACICIFAFEFIIGTFFFGQRMYTNGILLRNFRTDDYLLVLAFLCSTATQILVVYMYATGLFGSHAWEMSLDKYNSFSLALTISTLLYIPTTVLSKVILCFFYYRLSPATWYRYSVYITGFVCASSLVGIWFSVLFSCNPISASWDQRKVADAVCINRPPIYITQAAFGSVTDFMLLILPIPTLIGLQMDRKRKIGLIGLFSIGSITLVTSIVRLVLLLPSLSSIDQPWALSEGCIWVVVEANLLMMCASLPTLRIFLSNVAPSLFESQTASNSSSAYNPNKPGNNFNLRTFGGSGEPKRKFDTLVELEHEAYYAGDKNKLRDDTVVESDTHVYGGRDRMTPSEERIVPESGSEDGIVQTKTTTVSYMKR